MAMKPGLHPAPTPRFNATTIAILVALLFGMVFATAMAGNPFHAVRLAYTDYSREPVPPSNTLAKPDVSTVPPDATAQTAPKQ